MYGLVNKAIEEFVCSQGGEETWYNIKDKAGVTEVAFVSNEGYPDSLTYDLVGAASEVLEKDAGEILILFGEYWILETAQNNYGELIRAGGESLPEFLQNLPNFHARVSLLFPNLKPPSFKISQIKEKSLLLHYSSHREGLENFVVGIIQGLGKMFRTPATCTLVTTDAITEGAGDREFVVDWKERA
ncbi:MAG: hypothetical protein ACI9NC_004502 [Verrucomicrobiales bacterium]|jgi:hypothetical protein